MRQVGLCVVDELEVFWGYAGDAEGYLGVSEEGDDDALSVDAFHLAFDVLERSVEDAHSLALFVEEVGVGEGDALPVGVGTGGYIDEVLHLFLWDPYYLILLRPVE